MHTSVPLDKNLPILVVESQPAMRNVVLNCLRKLGFANITEAADASTAVELMNDNEFKFLIADWQMPDVPANEFLQAVRANEKYYNIPLLVVTAANKQAQPPKFEKDEPSGTIMKPFTSNILEQKMGEVMKCTEDQ